MDFSTTIYGLLNHLIIAKLHPEVADYENLNTLQSTEGYIESF